jgi:hypothetical protein
MSILPLLKPGSLHVVDSLLGVAIEEYFSVNVLPGINLDLDCLSDFPAARGGNADRVNNRGWLPTFNWRRFHMGLDEL